MVVGAGHGAALGFSRARGVFVVARVGGDDVRGLHATGGVIGELGTVTSVGAEREGVDRGAGARGGIGGELRHGDEGGLGRHWC